MSRVREAIDRLKCRIGLHIGYTKGTPTGVAFYCTRCETHTDHTNTEQWRKEFLR